jgi:hypothetical protein
MGAGTIRRILAAHRVDQRARDGHELAAVPAMFVAKAGAVGGVLGLELRHGPFDEVAAVGGEVQQRGRDRGFDGVGVERWMSVPAPLP